MTTLTHPSEQFPGPFVVNIDECAPGMGVEMPMARMREMALSRTGHASEAYAAQLGDREFVGLDSSWDRP